MRAVRSASPGGAESLELLDLPVPEPGPGEVRIRVERAGVNFADSLLLAGKYQVQPDFPLVPGLEVAGRIDALGKGVTAFAPGRTVLGLCSAGGWADYVVVRESRVAALPAGVDMTLAAATPVAYGTTHLALGRRARLCAGEVLLVTGAADGVGLTAVELGAGMGARVIAAANGTDKCALTLERGADVAIDLTSEDLRERVLALTDGRGADVVYEAVGGDVGTAALRATAFEGRFVLIGFASGTVTPLKANHLLVKNIDVIGFNWGGYGSGPGTAMRDSLAVLVDWLAEGRIRPHVSAVFPLPRAAEALGELTARRSTGKVIIDCTA